MANKIYTLGQVVGGKFEPDNSVTDPNLYNISTAASVTGTNIGNGRYKFLTIPDGRYVFRSATTVLNNVLGSIAEGGTWIGDEDLPYLYKATGGAVQEINTVVNFHQPVEFVEEIFAGNGIAVGSTTFVGNSAITKTYADAQYILASTAANLVTLDGIQTITGAKLFSGITSLRNTNIVTGYKFEHADLPATGFTVANKNYVDSEIAKVAAGNSGFQESPNVIRLVPNGVQENNKVYTSYAAAQYAAYLNASTNRLITIEIKGAGTGGRTIAVTNAGGGSNDFNSYVSLKGENQLTWLQTDDNAFSVVGDSVVIENLKFGRDDNGAGTPSYTSFVFKDCHLFFDTTSVAFANCVFKGTCDFDLSLNATFTNCRFVGSHTLKVATAGTLTMGTSNIGGHVRTNKALPATMQGTSSIAIAEL